MARAEVVWLVMRNGQPEATFTVKHELVTWLGSHGDDWLMDAEVWRCKDGPGIFDPVSVRPRRVPLAAL